MNSVGVGYRRHSFLDLYPIAGIVIHAHRAGDTVVFVANVVADDLGTGVVDRTALAFHRRGDLGLLVGCLDPVAGIPTADGARHRGQRLALAATDLVSSQATDHGADRRTGNPVLVLGRGRMRHRFVMADFFGVVHRRTHRIDTDHLGVLDSGIGTGRRVAGCTGVCATVASRNTCHQGRGDPRFKYIDHQTLHHHDLLCLVAA